MTVCYQFRVNTYSAFGLELKLHPIKSDYWFAISVGELNEMISGYQRATLICAWKIKSIK